MRWLVLSLLTLAACDGSGPAATGRLETAGVGGETGAGGSAGAAVAMTQDAGTAGATSPDAGVAETAAVATGTDGGTPEMGSSGPIQVTWTFKYCGDNAISVGVVDQTTNKGLAGPVQVSKPRGDVFVLQPVTFSCAGGDIVCWSASDKSGMCGACSNAMPVVGC